MKKVAVVILNWNGRKLLEEFLPSVVAHNPHYAEVVVADNGSTDDSVAYLHTHFPEVRVVVLDQNYGFAGGYNRALEAVEAEYVVLLNSDVAVSEGWIDPMLAYCEAHPTVAGCQPKIRAYRQPTHFEYAGAAGGYIDRYGYPYCRGRIFDTVEEDRGQYDSVEPIFWATGAALFLRLELFKRVQGFDEKFFAHMEEIDLCWRIQLLEMQLVAVPQSVVYHLGGATLEVGSPQKSYLNFRNNLLMLHKNLPLSTSRPLLLVRRLLDTLAIVKFAVSGELKHAQAVIKAHRHFAQMRSQYSDQPTYNLLKQSRYSRLNILVHYYLKGKRTFEKL